MSRMSGLGSIGRYGPPQQQDTTGAANPMLQGDPRFSGINGINPFDPRYPLTQVQNSPLLRQGFQRPTSTVPHDMQHGANPQYEQALHAQQMGEAVGRNNAYAAAQRQKMVNGGNGLYAMGPNGHALGAGSNVGQNGFGTFPGMPGSGQTSNANKDVGTAPGGGGGAATGGSIRPGLGGGGAGPIGGGGAGGAGAQLQGLVDSANNANQSRYDQLLGLSGQLSDAQTQREHQRRDWQLGRVDQQAITSGLAGTTILPNLERGVVDDSALRENEISDAGLRSKMGIIERRTDEPPNLGLYAGLLGQAGAAGGGGYGGFGPMNGAGVSRSHPNTNITPAGPDSSSYGGGGGVRGRGGLGGGGAGGPFRGQDGGEGFDGGSGGDFNGGMTPPSHLLDGPPPGYAAQVGMRGLGGAIGAAAGANMGGMGPGLGWSWGVDPRKY